MHRNIRRFVVAVTTALAIAGSGASHVRAQAQAAANDDTGSWFIELNGSVDAFRGQGQAAGIA